MPLLTVFRLTPSDIYYSYCYYYYYYYTTTILVRNDAAPTTVTSTTTSSNATSSNRMLSTTTTTTAVPATVVGIHNSQNPHPTGRQHSQNPLPPGSECVICLSNRKTTIMFPCRHLCCCSECAVLLSTRTISAHIPVLQNTIENEKKCPVCRKPVIVMFQLKAPS